MTYKIKNQSKRVYGIRREKTASERKIDYEDPYHVGKPGTWKCDKCGSSMIPFKQDAMGDIIVGCTNPYCMKHPDNRNSINVQLGKLLKQQQANTQRNYMDLKGNYY